MSNMSYCRFENTAPDLADCRENLEGRLGQHEAPARERLLMECLNIMDLIGVEFDGHDAEKRVRDFCNEQQGVEE